MNEVVTPEKPVVEAPGETTVQGDNFPKRRLINPAVPPQPQGPRYVGGIPDYTGMAPEQTYDGKHFSFGALSRDEIG